MYYVSVFLCLALLVVGSVSGNSRTTAKDDSIDQLLADPKLAQLLDNPDKLMEMLRNKLGDRFDEELEHAFGTVGNCHAVVDRPSTIIRTKESQRAGAVFLDAPEVASRDECIDYCCANKSCTTAIIKEQPGGGGGCYLFNCLEPNVCLFSQNKEFSAVQLDRSSQHSTASSDRTAPKFQHGHLYSTCDDADDCFKSEHVQCQSGFCLCQSGYHAENNEAICRPVTSSCNRYQFQCATGENPGQAGPCIPVYDRCDGVVQCQDGSDEENCPYSFVTKPANVTQRATHDNATIETSTNSSTAVAVQRLPTAATVSILSGDHSEKDSDADDEKMISSHASSWTLPAIKGAVVALVLGVAIVVILLIFALCHIRRMRWRYGKGRLRHAADADYLINGMYL